jgi:hypothetical protein
MHPDGLADNDAMSWAAKGFARKISPPSDFLDVSHNKPCDNQNARNSKGPSNDVFHRSPPSFCRISSGARRFRRFSRSSSADTRTDLTELFIGRFLFR